MPLKKALKFISHAQEEETREYAFRKYLSMQPEANPEKFPSFNEYWDMIMPKKIVLDNRPEDEIMQEILELEKSFTKGDGK